MKWSEKEFLWKEKKFNPFGVKCTWWISTLVFSNVKRCIWDGLMVSGRLQFYMQSKFLWARAFCFLFFLLFFSCLLKSLFNEHSHSKIFDIFFFLFFFCVIKNCECKNERKQSFSCVVVVVVICAPNSRSDTMKHLIIVHFIYFFFSLCFILRAGKKFFFLPTNTLLYHIIKRFYNRFSLRPYKLTMENALRNAQAQNQLYTLISYRWHVHITRM